MSESSITSPSSPPAGDAVAAETASSPVVASCDDEPPGRPPAMDLSGLSIDLQLETADCDPPLTGWLPRHLRAMAAAARVNEGQLGVTAVGDGRMSALHERYKGVAGPTDVLSFDLRDKATPGRPEPVKGDVVICLDEAARQARRRGHATRLEAALYAVHGLLHLLGEDDATRAAAARMHEREDELLQAVGLGRVYGAIPSHEAIEAGRRSVEDDTPEGRG